MLLSKDVIDKNKEQFHAKWAALWMWRLVWILYTRIWIKSFRQSFWLTICAETWWTAVWELPSVRFNSSRLEALVVVATCGCGSSLVVAVLRSPFSCVTCTPPSATDYQCLFFSVAFVWVKRLLTLGPVFFEAQLNIVDLGISEDLIQQLSKQQSWKTEIEGRGFSKRFFWRLEDPRMSEDQLNNNLELVSGRESLELIKTVGTGEQGIKEKQWIKDVDRFRAHPSTRSQSCNPFFWCLPKQQYWWYNDTMAIKGNKDVAVFPRTSVMNAPAVCSIDFNTKLKS